MGVAHSFIGRYKMDKKLNFKSSLSYVLYDYLNQLSKDELKKFYSILVHYWNDYKYFISPQSFLRFWIRVNGLCYMIDKDFPNPRKKYKELKIYCQQHPYYFIDKLRHELVVNLFCQHLEDRLDLLIHVAQKVKTEDLDSIEHYLNKALALE